MKILKYSEIKLWNEVDTKNSGVFSDKEALMMKIRDVKNEELLKKKEEILFTALKKRERNLLILLMIRKFKHR
jgi:hypothetical protein